MRVDARNFGALRSNQLKKNSSPHDRFNDLDRAELVDRLERLADVRKAVVARGKALISNPEYPDKKVIQQMSHLLAGKMRL
jgi:hypothetical protein